MYLQHDIYKCQYPDDMYVKYLIQIPYHHQVSDHVLCICKKKKTKRIKGFFFNYLKNSRYVDTFFPAAVFFKKNYTCFFVQSFILLLMFTCVVVIASFLTLLYMYLYVFMYTSVDMHKNSKKGTFFLVKSIRRIQMHMDEKKKRT